MGVRWCNPPSLSYDVQGVEIMLTRKERMKLWEKIYKLSDLINSENVPVGYSRTKLIDEMREIEDVLRKDVQEKEEIEKKYGKVINWANYHGE